MLYKSVLALSPPTSANSLDSLLSITHVHMFGADYVLN